MAESNSDIGNVTPNAELVHVALSEQRTALDVFTGVIRMRRSIRLLNRKLRISHYLPLTAALLEYVQATV